MRAQRANFFEITVSPPILHAQSGHGSVPPSQKNDQMLTTLPHFSLKWLTLPPIFMKVVDPPPIF